MQGAEEAALIPRSPPGQSPPGQVVGAGFLAAVVEEEAPGAAVLGEVVVAMEEE